MAGQVECFHYGGISIIGVLADKGQLCTIQSNIATFTILFVALMVVHLALYWWLLLAGLRPNLQWALLLVQAGLGLLIDQLLYGRRVSGFFVHLEVWLALAVAFVVVTMYIFRRLRPILLTLGGYVLLLATYAEISRVEVISSLNFLWNKDTAYTCVAMFLLVTLMFYLQLEQAHKRTQNLLRKLDNAHAQISAYALRIEELTTLTERQRLARELHDTLSQGLAGLVMQLDAANAYFGKGQAVQAQSIVTQAATRVRTILTETRYVIHDLRSGSPRPDDLPELVLEEVEHFSSATGIPCEVELDALAEACPEHCEHVLRAISESLTNVARHARATQVCIHAAYKCKSLEIAIRDNGIGFDPAATDTIPGHYGLVGLRERARLIGGQLEVLSQPGRGTCIRVCIPVDSARSRV